MIARPAISALCTMHFALCINVACRILAHDSNFVANAPDFGPPILHSHFSILILGCQPPKRLNPTHGAATHRPRLETQLSPFRTRSSTAGNHLSRTKPPFLAGFRVFVTGRRASLACGITGPRALITKTYLHPHLRQFGTHMPTPPARSPAPTPAIQPPQPPDQASNLGKWQTRETANYAQCTQFGFILRLQQY